MTARSEAKPSRLRRNLVEKEILDQAMVLFAERGFAGTTLKDVAEALGISRPALYYYFSSKEALLQRLVENLSGSDARALQTIRRRRGLGPAERLRAMALQLAHNAASNPLQARILSQTRHQLPAVLADAVRAAERSIVRDLTNVIEDGMNSGEFRRSNAHTIAMAIIGMSIWTAWWVDTDVSETMLDEIVNNIADFAVAGLAITDRGADRGSALGLFALIRGDLDELQRIVESTS